MIPTHVVPYRNGELRIGWASWDDGTFKDRSIKFAYRDNSGKISRGSPELPFDILIDMALLAGEQGELAPHLKPSNQGSLNLSTASKSDLVEERKSVALCLIRLQGLMLDAPWANWKPIYDQLGAWFEKVKDELSQRP